jgi:hypothetical protein
MRKQPYTTFKVIYRDGRGVVTGTVVGYSEDGANREADAMEDRGVEVIDVIECKPGTSLEEIERMYKDD